jgi:hypothetical protein
MLDELTSAQIEDLATGRGRLVYRPESTRRTRDQDPSGSAQDIAVAVAVAEINRMSTPLDVADYLEGQRYTVPVLREIARALGPTVEATGRSKEELTRNIVEGTAGFRTRSEAMSGGAWS